MMKMNFKLVRDIILDAAGIKEYFCPDQALINFHIENLIEGEYITGESTGYGYKVTGLDFYGYRLLELVRNEKRWEYLQDKLQERNYEFNQAMYMGFEFLEKL